VELELSTDQKLFQASTRSLLEKDHSLDRLRRLELGESPWDRDSWQRGVELGWAATIVPEELGGGSVSGDGVRDLTLLAEEMGAAVAPGPFLPVNVVLAGLVAAHGTGPDHSATIEALVSGEQVASWAVYEPGGQWAPESARVTATPTGDGWRLDGTKDRVEAGTEADLLLVTATGPEGLVQVLVPTAADGVAVSPQWALDLSRPLAEVRFDGVVVEAGAVVGTPAITAEVIERQLQIALLIQCAELCGGLDKMFALTMQWGFDRYSFGRPLASYQALKHRYADMRTWLEACHATTQAAADAVQTGSPHAAELVSVAKSFVAERAQVILQDCVQLHGGIGVTWEHDLHLYLRRATSDRALYGTPEDHRRRLADLSSL
jgi:alkylation response protein AidB-like acyl-CoA dehydrogenase